MPLAAFHYHSQTCQLRPDSLPATVARWRGGFPDLRFEFHEVVSRRSRGDPRGIHGHASRSVAGRRAQQEAGAGRGDDDVPLRGGADRGDMETFEDLALQN